VALSRQSAAADGRACNGAGRSKTTRQAPKPTAAGEGPSIAPRRSRAGRVPTTVVGAPAGRTGLAPVAPSAPDPAEYLQRRSAAVPSCCGPAPGNVSTWDDPEPGALAQTVVGTHSRGTWIDFRLIFNSVAGSNPPEALRRGDQGLFRCPRLGVQRAASGMAPVAPSAPSQRVRSEHVETFPDAGPRGEGTPRRLG
jgi:hypothetical protein